MFLLCLNFHETFFQLYFYRTPMGDCFWKLSNVGAHARLFIILATFRSSRGEVQIHRKVPVPESFSKGAGQGLQLYSKKDSGAGFLCEFLQNTSSGCF